MNIEIRKAELRDVQDIQKIAQISWNHTYEGIIPAPIQQRFLQKAYSDEFMEKRIAQTHLLVAEENGKVVGFANAFSDGSEAELSAIYLYPEYQGKGIGTRLLLHLMEEINTCKRLYVDVEKGNEAGETFYEAKGFQLAEEYDDDFYGHKLQTKKLVLNL